MLLVREGVRFLDKGGLDLREAREEPGSPGGLR